MNEQAFVDAAGIYETFRTAAELPGIQFKDRRLALGMSQCGAARMSGIRQQDISRIETGRFVDNGALKLEYAAFLGRVSGGER